MVMHIENILIHIENILRQIYKLKRMKKCPKLLLARINDNVVKRECIVVDQSRSDSDYLNDAGFVANDIYLINKAQSRAEFEVLANRLQEIGVSSVDNSNKSDRDIILSIRPAWCQTPSEIGRFADYFNSTHPVDEEKPKFESKELNNGSDSVSVDGSPSSPAANVNT